MVLENWLAGSAALQSPVTLNGDICRLGASSKLGFTASGQARFAPDWRMEVDAKDIATVSGLGSPLSSSQLTIQLLAPTDPSISQHPEPKRTLLKMPARGHIWTLAPEVANLPVGTLSLRPRGFQRHRDRGRGRTRRRYRTRVACHHQARPGRRRPSPAGSPIKMVIRSGSRWRRRRMPSRSTPRRTTPRVTKQRSATFLDTHMAGRERICFAGGRFISVAWFRIQRGQGEVVSLRCEPALIRAAAPLGSASGTSVAADPLDLIGATLPFVTAPGTTPGWGIVAGPEKAGQQRFSLPDFSVSVLRRDDLLALDFQFFNLALEGGGANHPSLCARTQPSPLSLSRSSTRRKNIAEQAYLEEVDDTTPKHQPPPSGNRPPDPQSFSAEIQTRLARSKRVRPGPVGWRSSFRPKPPHCRTLGSLLNWAARSKASFPSLRCPTPTRRTPTSRSLRSRHAPTQAPQIHQPSATETAIEAPWRLVLSPNYSGAWAHWSTPVTLRDRTELWHTRLAVRGHQGDEFTADETIPRRVRAVWSPDYTTGAIPHHLPPFNTEAAPFRMSLDPDDRDQIVRLSSDFTMTIPPGHAYPPISIPADKLYLTTLGAWIDVFGDWPDPLPVSGNEIFSVEQWQHRAALGRDNYVRVVYAGFLLPFGNAASLVKVTERKLQSINGGPTTAYLRQKFFIIVRQPTMSYQSLTLMQQRNLPYQSITITTLVTPDVVPQVVPGPDGSERYAFFPTNGQQISVPHHRNRLGRKHVGIHCAALLCRAWRGLRQSRCGV